MQNVRGDSSEGSYTRCENVTFSNEGSQGQLHECPSWRVQLRHVSKSMGSPSTQRNAARSAELNQVFQSELSELTSACHVCDDSVAA
jgi:hypothetical protein